MKVQLSYIVSLLFLSSLSSFVYAQDGGMQDIEMTVEVVDRDRIISSSSGESGSRYTPRTSYSSNKDSVGSNSQNNAPSSPVTPAPATNNKAQKPAANQKAPADKHAKEKDDSILSFNFLYYIIEKYKLQDIVD
ncbi:hypothetical protein [Chryseosolibacter indicus]|uniref:Uncharacterized protein n=1 Tax=Chryseosolibacter indicus TaxID=2782351 RepID=A0ABS5VTW5_9BACT|nr:hypothetical protein [Chryseosolibacter indicus]MBT1704209.1 hypothetical protein [Chryseosolibacter indicus]